nr:MAG TPA: hypothetical protein [Caudoviricetes sp.]
MRSLISIGITSLHRDNTTLLFVCQQKIFIFFAFAS